MYDISIKDFQNLCLIHCEKSRGICLLLEREYDCIRVSDCRMDDCDTLHVIINRSDDVREGDILITDDWSDEYENSVIIPKNKEINGHIRDIIHFILRSSVEQFDLPHVPC